MLQYSEVHTHTHSHTHTNTNTHSLDVYNRVKSDGSRVFKWGCTGEGPSQSCAEENRNRKKKICCRSSFCNQNISSDWIKGGDNTTTPTETTPTQATPTPVNSTRPPAAVITIDVAPTGEEDDNCTRARRGSSSSATLDNNCPWPGTGSVPDLTPDEVIPVPPELLPGGGTWSEQIHLQYSVYTVEPL